MPFELFFVINIVSFFLVVFQKLPVCSLETYTTKICDRKIECYNNGTFNLDTCKCDCQINFIGFDCSIGKKISSLK
jgi:hypothetical protein